jgi:ribosomal protein S18 acetylase RimI-like enzyme
MQTTYRPIKKSEQHFLEAMLYEALFVAEGQPKFPKSIIHRPEIYKYIRDWNQNEFDIAIVAISDDKLIGVVWGRRFDVESKGYGFVDSETPEISMAIQAEFRGRGIGTELLKQLEIAYLEIGVKQLSLSVDKRNRAKNLYERNGFIFFEDLETAVTLLKKI